MRSYEDMIDQQYAVLDRVIRAADELRARIRELLPADARELPYQKLQECIMWTAHKVGQVNDREHLLPVRHP